MKQKKLFFMLVLIIWTTMSSTVTFARTLDIEGNVSAQSGEPLIGASIVVKDSGIGTMTDAEGNFNLKNVPEKGILIVSYVGYETKNIRIRQTSYHIVLQLDENLLDDLVVVGYGTQKKSDLTGSVTSIKGKDINGIRSGNASEALQGKSGLYVITSGSPGTEPQVRIRGIGTNGDASPVYVVDGVMTSSISNINPKDIESMEVLKDASATAIYGSRGANGVIMVSTKRGKTGKAQVSYNGVEGFQYLRNNYKTANGTEYAILQNMVAHNKNIEIPYLNPDKIGHGTDWMNEISRHGWIHDHQLSVSGGSENVNYYLSAGYLKQDGVWENTNYDRWTFRVNNEYKLLTNLKIGHNISVTLSNTGQGLNYRMIRSVLAGSPLINPMNESGGWNSMQNGDLINPAAELVLGKDTRSNTKQYLGNIWGQWDIVEGLALRTSFAGTFVNSFNWSFRPEYNINPSHQNNPYSLYSEYFGNTSNWLWESTLNYQKHFNPDNYLNLLVGYTMEKNKQRGIGGEGHSYVENNLDYVSLNSASTDNRKLNPFERSIDSKMSYIARANYTLMNRYLLTATFRADGSSVFGTNNHWGYFPSAAIGWRMTEEQFLRNITWLSNLKLRASWGKTGNDKIKSNVSYALVTQSDEWHAIFNGKLYPAAGITTACNPDIKWEKNNQIDIGFDLGLFNNRLTAEFDYFNRKTTDLLMILPVEGGSVGITPTYSNVGSVRNKGWDFIIRWNDNIGDLKYSIALSGSHFKNKVLDWGGQITTDTQYSTNLTTRIEKGKPFGYFYGYKTQGLYRSQADIDYWNNYARSKNHNIYHPNAQLGDPIYVDVNGDGTINDDDLTDIGNPFPKFTGSLNLSAEFRGFDLSLDFTGSFGAKVLNNSYNDFNNDTNNMHTDWLNSWTPENSGARLPRLAAGSIAMSRTIDLIALNGDYVKLRSAELGYTFPSRLTKQAHISNLRLFVSASNLFYWTKYKGFSPEVEKGLDSNSYPMTGSFQFGVNLSF